MKLVVGGRQSGKTTWLIKESARTGSTIVCAHSALARDIQEQASRIGLKIPCPMSFQELQYGQRMHGVKGVLIDDAAHFIQYIARHPVDAIVIEDRAECEFEVREFDYKKGVVNSITPRMEG